MGSQSQSQWDDPPSVPQPGQSLVCPICQAGVSRVLDQREIYISDKVEIRKVGAPLAAFRCDRAGHIFFVLAQELK